MFRPFIGHYEGATAITKRVYKNGIGYVSTHQLWIYSVKYIIKHQIYESYDGSWRSEIYACTLTKTT
jgi:hypothetical protein